MKIVAHPDEARLWRAVCNGDSRSFEILFHHYYKPFGHYCYRLLEDLSQVEDVLQEVFLQLWIQKEKLQAILSIKDYLFILIRNRVYNLLKARAKKQILFESLDDDVAEKDWSQYVEPESQDLEPYYVLLEQEIERLPSQQQEVFRLAKIKRLSYEQISTSLNLSIETVRKHLYLATKTLRKKMNGREGELFILILTAIFEKK